MPNASGDADQKFLLYLLIIGISAFFALLLWPILSPLIFRTGNVSKDYVLDNAKEVVFLVPYFITGSSKITKGEICEPLYGTSFP